MSDDYPTDDTWDQMINSLRGNNQIDIDNAWHDGYEAALENVLPVFKKLIADLAPYRRYDFVEGKIIHDALDKAETWLWETNND